MPGLARARRQTAGPARLGDARRSATPGAACSGRCHRRGARDRRIHARSSCSTSATTSAPGRRATRHDPARGAHPQRACRRSWRRSGIRRRSPRLDGRRPRRSRDRRQDRSALRPAGPHHRASPARSATTPGRTGGRAAAGSPSTPGVEHVVDLDGGGTVLLTTKSVPAAGSGQYAALGRRCRRAPDHRLEGRLLDPRRLPDGAAASSRSTRRGSPPRT